MYRFSQIEFKSVFPAPWELIIPVMILLGFYISLVSLVSSRLRKNRRCFLGIYTAVLSILLVYVSAIAHPGLSWEVPLRFMGTASLFLIGPFSYLLSTIVSCPARRDYHYFYYLPALLAGSVAVLIPGKEMIYHLGGIVFTGCWLGVQLVKVCSARFRSKAFPAAEATGNHTWNKAFTALQILLFGIICISLSTRHTIIIIAGCIAFLIMTIWIRLVYSAYLQCTTDRNRS